MLNNLRTNPLPTAESPNTAAPSLDGLTTGPEGLRLPPALSSGETFYVSDKKEDARERSSTLEPSTDPSTQLLAISAIARAANTGGVFVRSVRNATPQLIEIVDTRGVAGEAHNERVAKRALDTLLLIAQKYPNEDFGKEARAALERIANDENSTVRAHAQTLLKPKE